MASIGEAIGGLMIGSWDVRVHGSWRECHFVFSNRGSHAPLSSPFEGAKDAPSRGLSKHRRVPQWPSYFRPCISNLFVKYYYAIIYLLFLDPVLTLGNFNGSLSFAIK